MIFFFQVAEIQGLSSRLVVQNSHMSTALQECQLSATKTLRENTNQLQLKQKNHDDQVHLYTDVW